MPINEIAVESEPTTKEFIQSISENGNRIVFQLHSDPPYIYRSFSLNGTRPHIHAILDFLSGQIRRDLKFVYDYDGHRWRISFAPYVK